MTPTSERKSTKDNAGRVELNYASQSIYCQYQSQTSPIKKASDCDCQRSKEKRKQLKQDTTPKISATTSNPSIVEPTVSVSKHKLSFFSEENITGNSLKLEDPVKYQLWYNAQKQSCDINHFGSSGTMEAWSSKLQ
nr:hypothetical protein BgiMline_006392 [Biomphalaria glabrata]